MAGRPLVSVIIPAYNRATTIGSTLDTITCQKGWPFEIIVVDDGSGDDTAAIARRYAPEARVIVQDNQRRSAARNNGAKLAVGEFLYFFDSDDLMEPNAIARLAACLADNPDVAVAYGSALQFVDDPAAAVPRVPGCAKSGDLLHEHLEQPFLIPVMAMVRREWYERVGGMTTRLDYCEDYHFFLKLSVLGGAVPMHRWAARRSLSRICDAATARQRPRAWVRHGAADDRRRVRRSGSS